MLYKSARRKSRFVAAFFLSAAVALFLRGNCHAQQSFEAPVEPSHCIELTSGWEFFDTGPEVWESFSYPGKPSVTGSGIVYERVLLPEGSWRDPYLYIKADNQLIDIYYDNNHIYSSSVSYAIAKNIPGFFWNIIQLPVESPGHYLTFRMQSRDPQNTGTVLKAYMGPMSEMLANLIKGDLAGTILAFILLFIGITGFTAMSRKYNAPAFPLAFLSANTGLWVFSVTDVIKYMLINNDEFWSYLSYFLVYIIPVGFCLYLYCFLKCPPKKLLRIPCILFTVLAVSSIILGLAGVVSIGLSIGIFIMMVILTMALAGVLIVMDMQMGDLILKILLAGFMSMSPFIIYDILGWYLRLIPWRHFATGWGILLYVLATIFIFSRKLLHTHTQLENCHTEVLHKEEILKASEKLLQETMEYDRLKNEFISNISHEFRTPLNIILANLQLMNYYVENGSITSTTKNMEKYLKAMRLNSYRLMKLINNVIDMTKIDSGYMVPVFKTCDIVEAVREIACSASDFVESRGISLYFRSNTEEFSISCDQEKIERSVLNLLSNAVKFTGSGGSISISVDCQPENVSIAISDSGIGIPDEKLGTIFERFSQVDRSFTRSYEGSGIGLSLVRSLIEMHNGKINVESEYGKGSIFTISIPVSQAETADDGWEEAYTARKDIGVKSGKDHKEVVYIEFSDIS